MNGGGELVFSNGNIYNGQFLNDKRFAVNSLLKFFIKARRGSN